MRDVDPGPCPDPVDLGPDPPAGCLPGCWACCPLEFTRGLMDGAPSVPLWWGPGLGLGSGTCLMGRAWAWGSGTYLMDQALAGVQAPASWARPGPGFRHLPHGPDLGTGLIGPGLGLGSGTGLMGQAWAWVVY